MIRFSNLSDYDYYSLKKIFLEYDVRVEFEENNTILIDKNDLIYFFRKNF